MQITLIDAIARLKNGEVVAIPTETVYGLAGDATNPEALKKIYAVKQRPATNPLIVHIAGVEAVEKWAAEFPLLAQKMATAFWPGPLTLVLTAKPHVSKILTAGQDTVALRVPNHPLSLQLLKQSGLSLAAPSANKYTQLSPTTAAHVVTGLGEDIPVLDGGTCQVGIESSIVHVFKNNAGWQWQLLRQGMVSEAEITVLVGQMQQKNSLQEQTPNVPGQHLLHYAPRTPLALLANKAAIQEQVNTLLLQNKTCAVLLLDDSPPALQSICHAEVLPSQPKVYAAHLYATLHQLDRLGVQQLLVETPPEEAAWLPVLDRLKRATHSKL